MNCRVVGWFLALGWVASGFPGTFELVSTNAAWRYFKGTRETSTPNPTAWRGVGFADPAWATGLAPFSYGEAAITTGTRLPDMQNSFSSLFLRRTFTVSNPGEVASLDLAAVCDDGFIAWINGREVGRSGVAAGEPRFDTLASVNATEPVRFQFFPVAAPEQVLVPGTNVLAVQVFNVSLGSSDLVFDAGLAATTRETGPPTIVEVTPAPGLIGALNQITVTFSEPVNGVTAEQFLVNERSAERVSGGGSVYTFAFPQPAYGTVQVRWSTFHTIRDFESPPQRFEIAAPGSTWAYELLDPEGPSVISRQPPAELTLRSLSQVEVTFDKAVLGVDATDLLLNGVGATDVAGIGAGPYRFGFAAAAAGPVRVEWVSGHGIVSDAPAPHAFTGGGWAYTVDPGAVVPVLEITEFMAENLTAYRDEELDPEDWIEIRNPGPAAVSLLGWSLSDELDEPGKWAFPAVTLPPGEYLVVFASGKNRAPTIGGARLHTNFKLNPNGGYLGLFGPGLPRVAVNEIEYPVQGPDHSYGREQDVGSWKYYLKGTPGARNPPGRISSAVADVRFSVPRGVFNRAFNLSLHCPTPGATIIYTTNSSVPMLTNGFVYTQPLAIPGTCVIRAAAFLTNAMPSRVQTHTYLMNLTATRLRLPSLSLVTSSNNLYGRTGIMQPPNPANRGSQWERPVSIEWIRPEDNGGFQADCGIRVAGGDYVRGRYDYRSGSLPFNKYSFRLYFRGEYGPGRLNERLFPDTTQESFDVITLRAGMNDPSNPFIIDEFVRGLARDVGQPSAVGTFVNVYLNGVFKGYYNPCERIDEEFLRAYHGGGENWDIIAQGGEIQEGTAVAWNALRNFANTRNLTNQTEYLALARQLDLTNFVDDLCPLIYVDNDDWPHNNWRVARERVPTGLLRFYVWDAEWACGMMTGHAPSFNTINNQLSTTSPPWGGSEIQTLFGKLRRIPEFKLLFADRVHQHFFNDGALTDARIRFRYQTIKNRLNGTISGFDDRIGTTWIPQRRRHVLEHFRLAGFLSSSNAPGFNLPSGRAPAGFALQLTNAAGAIYYTTNSTDPRVMFTSQVATDARLFSAGQPLLLDRDLEICARSLDGTNWSALAKGRYQVERLGWPLRFTEIMYHPPGGDAFEFLELANTGGVAVDLSGFSLEGVTFHFPEPSPFLDPGERLVVASNDDPQAFAARYPAVTVAGWYAGALNNGGERIALLDRAGRVVTAVTYRDGGPWPEEADGDGHSLEFTRLEGHPDEPAHWQASARIGGTPGLANSVAVQPSVRLNEVYAAGEGGTGAAEGVETDWLELFNAGTTSVALGGWTLQGDGVTAFSFPAGMTLPAGGFLRVWCDSQTSPAGLHTGFGLSRTGETVWLSDTQGRRVDVVTFGLQVAGLSVGRVGADGGWRLTEPTPGSPNEVASLAPRGTVVVNEFLANPPPGADDWIELHNTDPALPASLQGLWLATSNAVEQITALSFLAPAGFGVLKADGNAGADHLGFRLPASGDTLRLFEANGEERQGLAYRNAVEGVSSGLLPDGTGTLTTFPNSASPGAPNQLLTNTTLRLNEVLARAETYSLPGATSRVDWIELVNLGAAPVPLAGHSLTLGRREPGEWLFPSGTSLPPGGFLVIHCDSSQPASTTSAQPLNLGRSLKDTGDAVRWFDARGQLLDTVAFGFALPDRTVGRVGEVWGLLAAPTPGQPNALPALVGDPAAVRLNEWLATGDGEDWIELFNPQSLPVNLAWLRFTDDPSLAGQTNHIVRDLTFIPAQGWVWWRADGRTDEGPEHLPFSLNALGETLRLYLPNLTLVDSVDLLVQTPGVSEGRFPDGGTEIRRFAGTTSRGTANFVAHPQVVINEVLSHTDPPLEHAIEVRNLGDTPVELGGWFLSDSLEHWRKYRVPSGTLLPPSGYVVFYEAQFNAASLGPDAFGLNSAQGDEVWLSAADGSSRFLGQRAGAPFGAAKAGVSFGRFETSQGADLVPMSFRTFGVDLPATVEQFRQGTGRANAYPQVGPIVVSEIHYQPASRQGVTAVENPNEEFIELLNISAQPVQLFDPERPANRWRFGDGVAFEFPPDAVLAAGAYALVVAFRPEGDPVLRATFTAKHNVPPGTRFFGPFTGRLANEGEGVELQAPDTPRPASGSDAGLVPYVLVERVTYRPGYPWPVGAAGTGLSLQRLDTGAYGNEPLNWRAGRPSPGRSVPPTGADSDSDGLPDDWELAQGLDPDLAAGDQGADGDPDGDGLTNLREWQTGNSPREFSLVILAMRVEARRLQLTFNAAGGRAYRLEVRRGSVEAPWEVATNLLPSQTGELEFEIGLDAGLEAAFYRLVTP